MRHRRNWARDPRKKSVPGRARLFCTRIKWRSEILFNADVEEPAQGQRARDVRAESQAFTTMGPRTRVEEIRSTDADGAAPESAVANLSANDRARVLAPALGGILVVEPVVDIVGRDAGAVALVVPRGRGGGLPAGIKIIAG